MAIHHTRFPGVRTKPDYATSPNQHTVNQIKNI